MGKRTGGRTDNELKGRREGEATWKKRIVQTRQGSKTNKGNVMGESLPTPASCRITSSARGVSAVDKYTSVH